MEARWVRRSDSRDDDDDGSGVVFSVDVDVDDDDVVVVAVGEGILGCEVGLLLFLEERGRMKLKESGWWW